MRNSITSKVNEVEWRIVKQCQQGSRIYWVTVGFASGKLKTDTASDILTHAVKYACYNGLAKMNYYGIGSNV